MRLLFAFFLVFAVGCSSAPIKRSNIAAACETATAALEALTAARRADRITKAQLDAAISIHESTNRFCQPVAESLSPADLAALLTAAARLTTQQGELQ